MQNSTKMAFRICHTVHSFLGTPQLRFIMKVNLLALLLMVSTAPFLFATTGKGQDLESTQVTLELRNEALSKALSQIESQSNFRFTYKVDEVSRYKGIKLKRDTRSVKETLQLLLNGTRLEYQQIDNYIILSA